MTHTLWYDIAKTPWWIYVLFVYLAWIAILATRPRLTPVKSLYILPLVFVALSSMCMSAMLQSVTMVTVMLWVATMLLGAGLGYLHYSFCKIKAIKQSAAIYLPGSLLPLFALIILVVTKSYYGFDFTMNILALIRPKYLTAFLMVYGLLTGLSIGRLGYALRSQQSGPYLTQETLAAT